MDLWRRRAAALSSEEPRDDSVPAELQDEDRDLPMPWSRAALAVAVLFVMIVAASFKYGL